MWQLLAANEFNNKNDPSDCNGVKYNGYLTHRCKNDSLRCLTVM